MKIAVAGTGYVGLSLAVLLSQKYRVTAVDIVQEKIDLINRRISPIKDEYIEQYLREKDLNLLATMDAEEAYSQADIIIIATPTNYDPETNYFDTSSVEAVLDVVSRCNPNAVLVIKSTIPVGYTQQMRSRYDHIKLLFSPEFLRESKALYDNLYPSRIIVGTDTSDPMLMDVAKNFAAMLRECALKTDIPVLIMNTTEAEAVKLFANTYLVPKLPVRSQSIQGRDRAKRRHGDVGDQAQRARILPPGFPQQSEHGYPLRRRKLRRGRAGSLSDTLHEKRV